MIVVYLRLIAMAALASVAQSELSDYQRELLLVGLTDIKRDTVNGGVFMNNGSIPTWLKGNFIRHACSVFGETARMRESPLNYIQHLFDCIPMATKFRIENGQASFTNRRYDTNEEDFYNSYGRNMNESGVFVGVAGFTQRNASQVENCQNSNVLNKTPNVPHVTWWKIGDDVIAMAERPTGVIVDPESAVQKGKFEYNDDNMGYGSDVMFQNNPAHEQAGENGTIWSTVMAFQFRPNASVLQQWRVVYKVGADKVRHVVGEYPYADVDLSNCSTTPPFLVYPDPDARFGYMHSFVATQNYIVLPETAFKFNPCFYANYQQYRPYFEQAFQYESSLSSRILVMEKSTGNFVANVTVRPFFVSHQLGAFEDGDDIHMDMLMYNDSSIYYATSVRGLLSENNYKTDVMRISLNLIDKSAIFKNLRPQRPPTAIELSAINEAYYGQKYTYAYMVKNWDRVTENNTITKLNVDTGEELDYVFPIGMFPQEPQFVSRPNPDSEDDGVILTQGIDANKKKAFLTVLDARTLSPLAHMTASDYSTFGIHNRLFELENEENGSEGVSGTIWKTLIFVMCCLSLLFIKY